MTTIIIVVSYTGLLYMKNESEIDRLKSEANLICSIISSLLPYDFSGKHSFNKRLMIVESEIKELENAESMAD